MSDRAPLINASGMEWYALDHDGNHLSFSIEIEPDGALEVYIDEGQPYKGCATFRFDAERSPAFLVALQAWIESLPNGSPEGG